MTLLIIPTIGLGVLLFSRRIFGKWFNHLSLYFMVWTSMLFLFELRLFRYFPLKNETWYVIVLAAFSFLSGSLLVYTAKRMYPHEGESKKRLLIISDEGKLLKIFLIITGLIGLIAALYDWYTLIHKYGSIVKVLLAASDIYRKRVENKMEGNIPYIQVFSYVGVVLASIYTAYKNKISFFSMVPLLAVIIKSLASFSRIGILIGFVEFIAGYFLTRHFLSGNYQKVKLHVRTVLLILVVFSAIVLAAGTVKTFRGTYEKYRGADPSLAQLKDNPFFSPSIYLYLSSHVGVLNQFLQDPEQHFRTGENTFAAFFNFLSKFGLVEKVPFNLRGYYIPMWSNTGTYLRDLYGDFNTLGVCFVPWLLGFLSSFCWYRFFETGRSSYLAVLIHLYAVIGITFFSFITRGADWWLGMFLLLLLIPFIEKKSIARSAVK